MIMKKSEIILKNEKKISEVLFELNKEIQKAGDEFEEFWYQAKSFYFSLANEMKTIMEEIEKSQRLKYGFFKYLIKSNNYISNSEADFISKRLKVLEKQIPGLLKQLKQVIDPICSIHDSTQEYLIYGEHEALLALKKHWLAPSLIYFENFLKEYRHSIQHVAKEVKNVSIKPMAKDMKNLKKAIADLEEQQFFLLFIVIYCDQQKCKVV
ncbi:22032_t:CDS:2 [Gigaspora margarita]|uniref:22032_t:CDS:1 n=1 Tax=Gigaspora margarita TaxID=4874 RepID=A0ABN7VDB8_GIGMA|nr:22032_t:CDS:2 [Gigaspora margarita]